MHGSVAFTWTPTQLQAITSRQPGLTDDGQCGWTPTLRVACRGSLVGVSSAGHARVGTNSTPPLAFTSAVSRSLHQASTFRASLSARQKNKADTAVMGLAQRYDNTSSTT